MKTRRLVNYEKEQKPTVFVSQNYRYICDTCEPLKSAIKRKSLDWIGIKRGLYPGVDFKSYELESLRLLAYWDAKKKQDWRLDFHRNEGLEIAFVENGSVEFSTDRTGEYSMLSRDEIVVTKPWQEHSIGKTHIDACKMYFIIIDFGVRKPNQNWEWPSWVLLSESDKKIFAEYMQKTKTSVFKSTPNTKATFAKIGKILSAEGKLDISRLAFLLNAVIFELLDVFRNDKTDYSGASTTEETVKHFLKQLPNYCAEQWTIESMAEDCGLKPTRFSYYCRLLTNLSPIEFLNKVRLETAKKMIESSEKKSLLEISLDCGFSSSQYFSTLFKRRFGKPPRSFMKKDV